MSLVANYDSSSDNEEPETSTTIKKKNETTKSNTGVPTRQGLLSSLPPPKKVTGVVKIAIPSVPTNDSDDEDEVSNTKPKYSYKAGSRLMDMLPAPKSAMLTKIKLNKASTTNKGQDKQPMIPYTLTKKKNVKRNDNMPDNNQTNSVNLHENDDSIVAGGFFGNLDNNIPSSSSVPSTSCTHKQNIIDHSKYDNLSNLNHPNSAPYLSFEESEPNTYQNQTSMIGTSHSTQYDQSSQYRYGYPDSNLTSYADVDESSSQSNYHEKNFINELKQDKEFLRMQGKRKRGEPEMIDIIDVNEADHITDAAKFRQKFSTEELSYKPEDNSRLKPSQVQKRKHQITYLAFQAKERELELKNTWAANRATRRQTQSKYGF